MMREGVRVILASASPRRRELLQQIGVEFQVHVSDVEEKADMKVPDLLVQALSGQKAEAVFLELSKEADGLLVIGADTVVACDGEILGKPKDSGQAAAMLGRLQGREHEVYTGVTLLYRAERAAETVRRSFYEMTRVRFYPMSEEEIAAYVATKDPLDKAGAYGIQGMCARYISGINGDYNNVVGLPVGRLYQEIREWI
ncbi:MAG: Maf family protein [Candidatus Gastranaerophilales bacterium]|nr:Maf family protein [Candidatus Gastranaerophilales bacterium]